MTNSQTSSEICIRRFWFSCTFLILRSFSEKRSISWRGRSSSVHRVIRILRQSALSGKRRCVRRHSCRADWCPPTRRRRWIFNNCQLMLFGCNTPALSKILIACNLFNHNKYAFILITPRVNVLNSVYTWTVDVFSTHQPVRTFLNGLISLLSSISNKNLLSM